MTRRNRDLRANGSLILCACELDYALEEFEESGNLEDWEPGENYNQDQAVREIIESAFSIRDQIIQVNAEGRG